MYVDHENPGGTDDIESGSSVILCLSGYKILQLVVMAVLLWLCCYGCVVMVVRT